MTPKKATRFSSAEKAAMKARAKELRSETRESKDRAAGESAAKAAIASMKQPDRLMAERVHAIVKKCAPGLAAKTWYGMPAYAKAGGKVVCFFQAAGKFGARYATLGFTDGAKLDQGRMWPVAFALAEVSPIEEAQIRELIQRAVS